MLEAVRQTVATLTSEGMPFETTTAVIKGEEYTVFRNTPNNLREVFEGIAQHGDATAFVYQEDRISYSEFAARVAATAQGLVEELGIKTGDRVAIAMRNYPEWVIAFFAITTIGAVAVPLNSWGTEEELLYGLEDSGSHVVFVDGQRLQKLQGDLAEKGLTAILCRDEGEAAERVVLLNDWIAKFAGKGLPDRSAGELDDVVLIMYTSGTTGHPKGVVTTNRALLTGMLNCEMSGAIVGMQYPEIMAMAQQSTQQPAGILTVPLFHVSGLHATVLPALRGGRRIVMMYKWDPKEALKLIQTEGVSALNGAPKMIEGFLDAAEEEGADISRMVSLSTGGQAQPEALTRRMRAAVPHGMMGAGYGMTEASSTICNLAGPMCLEHPKSVGIALPTAELQVRDDEGKEVPVGERGEIWVRGAMVMEGYWNKPHETDEVLHGSWYATGDIGVMDENGILSIVDRKKEIVIRGGENIGCAEVEHAVDTMPAVAECAAYGIPDEEWGEALVMVVRCKEGESLTEDEVKAEVGKHLAAFKIPSHVYFASEPFPRNATNKVLKKQLKEQFS